MKFNPFSCNAKHSNLNRTNSESQTNPDSGGKDSEWVFYFKLYCVFDPIDAREDSIEYHFVYEDVSREFLCFHSVILVFLIENLPRLILSSW